MHVCAWLHATWFAAGPVLGTTPNLPRHVQAPNTACSSPPAWPCRMPWQLLESFSSGSWLRPLQWEAHIEPDSRDFVCKNLPAQHRLGAGAEREEPHNPYEDNYYHDDDDGLGPRGGSLFNSRWGSYEAASQAAAEALAQALQEEEGVDVTSGMACAGLSAIYASLRAGERPWNRERGGGDDDDDEDWLADADGFIPVLSRAERRARTDLLADWLAGNVAEDWRHGRLREADTVGALAGRPGPGWWACACMLLPV